MCIYRCVDPALARLDPHLGAVESYTRQAHVLSEVVAPGRDVFPPGVQCDACNDSFGRNLEPQLAYHPGIAWDIQRMRVPRKGGRSRTQVANVLRESTQALRVPTTAPRASGNIEGVPLIKIAHVQDPRFNQARFRRVLHMLAFNTLAYIAGDEVVRHPRYDAVRRYVRWPVDGDVEWTFAELYRGREGTNYAAWVYDFSDAGQIVQIEIFSYVFYVDLLNRGHLAGWLAMQGLDRARLIQPGERYVKSPRPDELPPTGPWSMTVRFK
jgi:hypothetical protein